MTLIIKKSNNYSSGDKNVDELSGSKWKGEEERRRGEEAKSKEEKKEGRQERRRRSQEPLIAVVFDLPVGEVAQTVCQRHNPRDLARERQMSLHLSSAVSRPVHLSPQPSSAPSLHDPPISASPRPREALHPN
ncbi:unnamed protein product [Pleuronectes platessa]|uniref:Uncharacterized protein n=1 Tax=Pleuronectes platessa TaxID=8262 RepID=A0A9N7TUE6_PLEPL|nr:unnamed protein product [Pleuronectes platessa]